MNLPMDKELEEKFERLRENVLKHELMADHPAPEARIPLKSDHNIGSLAVTLDDIERGIIESKIKLDLGTSAGPIEEVGTRRMPEMTMSPYIKIILRNTDVILLYEQQSVTVPRDSEEARLVEEDNQLYDYLTKGEGRLRRRHSAEAQTLKTLCKTRGVYTETISKAHVGCYVSNFVMFDTYKDMETSTQSVDIDGRKKLEITTYKVGGVDQFVEINKLPNFKLALMITMRVLAGNVYEPQQRRFRNMSLPDPLAADVRYRYRLEELWRYKPSYLMETVEGGGGVGGDDVENDGDVNGNNGNAGNRQAVADMSWCPTNGDILAVAYGIYSYSNPDLPKAGSVCVWNIKNPVNPERCYHYATPVDTIEFSPFMSQLIAIGMHDGSIEVRDITTADQPPIAVTQRKSSPSFEPITAIKWIMAGHLPKADDERCEDIRAEMAREMEAAEAEAAAEAAAANKEAKAIETEVDEAWSAEQSELDYIYENLEYPERPARDESEIEIEPFLALSRDGSVTRYSIINSPYLLAFRQILLDRVEGNPEGLPFPEAGKKPLLPASGHPHGLDLCSHPEQDDVYYVLTDEGCQHTGSLNRPMQQCDVKRLHEAGINWMEFSPWSPKLFLTCGNDWCIRIWLDGILRPLITLQHGYGPVHCASWSRTNSTVIVSLNRSSIDVWDIRRSTLKPMSSTRTDNSYHTLCKLSACGRSLAVGNENGCVMMLAFEDMPFPTHYQFDDLERTIFKVISNDAELSKQVKSIGFFGYGNGSKRQKKKKKKKAKTTDSDSD